MSFRRQSAKGHCNDVAGQNRASAPVYGSLQRPRPARNRLAFHDADGSFPAINIPLVTVIWASNRIVPDDILTPCPNPDIAEGVWGRKESPSMIAISFRVIQMCA